MPNEEKKIKDKEKSQTMKMMIPKILMMIILGQTLLRAQAYDIRLVQSSSRDTLKVDMYLQTMGGNSDRLGDATFVFEFNPANLSYLGKDEDYDGRWDNNTTGDYFDMFSINVGVNTSMDVIRSSSGSGLDIPGEMTRVGRVMFRIEVLDVLSGVSWSQTIPPSIYSWTGENITSRFNLVEPGDFMLTTLTGVEDREIYSIPETFDLSQNYPNPFNPDTRFHYQLPEGCDVSIAIYSLLGQKVLDVIQEKQPAGHYEAQWDGMDNFGRPVPSGMYIIRMNAGEFKTIRKMTLIR
jgi:hypothetical protein